MSGSSNFTTFADSMSLLPSFRFGVAPGVGEGVGELEPEAESALLSDVHPATRVTASSSPITSQTRRCMLIRRNNRARGSPGAQPSSCASPTRHRVRGCPVRSKWLRRSVACHALQRSGSHADTDCMAEASLTEWRAGASSGGVRSRLGVIGFARFLGVH